MGSGDKEIKLSGPGEVRKPGDEEGISLGVRGANARRIEALTASRDYFGPEVARAVFLDGRWREGWGMGGRFYIFGEAQPGFDEPDSDGCKGVFNSAFPVEAEAFLNQLSAVRASLEERGRSATRNKIFLARLEGFLFGAIAAFLVVEIML